ncbi:hypothetical protein MKW94_010187, partial [Papaver nudicaule]|nr:hypothetical protein [Papaver nudicaule]
MNVLATGSWDKTLPEKCYALSVKYPLMVVGTSDRNLIIFNLNKPQEEFKRIASPLKYQTRYGSFSFWDKDNKQRLKAMCRCSNPIPCSAFNSD